LPPVVEVLLIGECWTKLPEFAHEIWVTVMENSGLLQGAKLQSSAFISQLSVAALIDQWDGTINLPSILSLLNTIFLLKFCLLC
jgi:hypothetical protein